MTEPSTQSSSTNPSSQTDKSPEQARPGSNPAFVTDAEKKAQADKAKTAGSYGAAKDEPQVNRYSSKS